MSIQPAQTTFPMAALSPVLPQNAGAGKPSAEAAEFQKILDAKLRGIESDMPVSTEVPVVKKKQEDPAAKEAQNQNDPGAKERVYDKPALNSNDNAESVTPVVSADDFSFGDLLDVINPLQHIPILSAFYRSITGDTISPTATVAGGLLFGGPLGMLASAADAIFAQENGGKDMGQALIAGLVSPANNKTANVSVADDTDTLTEQADDGKKQQRLAQDEADDSGDAETSAVNIAELPPAQFTPMIQTNPAKDAAPIAPIAMEKPAPVVPAQMPLHMMQALDKYEAMMRERNKTMTPPPGPAATQ